MRIVCLTSNEYIHCIEPFAHYWNRFGGAGHEVLVAGYDVAPPALPRNFTFFRIGRQAAFTWSAGLKRLIFQLDEPLVLLMLEDYFLTERPDWDKIDWLADHMRRHTQIAKADLTEDRLKVPHHPDSHVKGLIISAWDAPFQASVQAAIWRTSLLWDCLDDTENAWQFEKNGTKRMVRDRRRGQLTQLIVGCREPPMRYANAVGGAGSKPGVIEARHMPDWMFQECVEKGWAHG